MAELEGAGLADAGAAVAGGVAVLMICSSWKCRSWPGQQSFQELVLWELVVPARPE
jgi:hypothetical protein